MAHDNLPADLNRLTGEIVHAIGDVRAGLGAGLLERPYKSCLTEELRRRGHAVELEVPVHVEWRGRVLGEALRLDILVDGRVIVECKAVSQLLPVHFAQVLTYLRLSRHPVALLVNFNAVPLRDGIHRLLPPA